MIRYIKLLVIFLLTDHIGFSQNIKHEVSNAYITQTNDGYMTYGTIKEKLVLTFYDKSLNEVARVESILKKKTKGFAASKQGEQLVLSSKSECITIDLTEKEIISASTPEYNKELYGKEDMTNYVPFTTMAHYFGINNSIQIGDYYYEVIQQSSSSAFNYGGLGPADVHNAANGIRYSGGSQIRCFRKNDSQSYSSTFQLVWKHKFSDDKLVDLQWFNLGDQHLYLQLTLKGQGDVTRIYKIDPKTGVYLFETELTINNHSNAMLSTMIKDSADNIIIIGNALSFNGEQNCFVIKLDSNGGKLMEKTFPISDIVETKFNNYTTSDLSFIRFVNAEFNENGNLELYAENFRYFVLVPIVLTPETERLPNTIAWQPYGYSYFELNSEFEIESETYREAFFTSIKNPNSHYSLLYHDNKQTPSLPDLRNVMKSDFQYLTQKTLLKTKSFGDEKAIIFRQKEKSPVIYNYYYMTLSDNIKQKKILLNSRKSSENIHYFFKNHSEIIEFIPSKKSYQLRVIKV